MKIISICDDKDICTGLRLVGIEGSVVQTFDEFTRALNNAFSDHKAGIVVVSKSLSNQYAGQIDKLRLSKSIPLIIEI